MVQYIGGRLISFMGAPFHVMVMAVSLFVVFTHFSRYKNGDYIKWMLLLAFTLGLTIVVTIGGLSIGTTVTVFCRFLVTWAAISWNYDYFVERLIKLSAFLCLISCILFAIIAILGVGAVRWLMSYLPVVYGNRGTPVTYGLFLIVFNVMDLTRNAGIFGEPGELQILVNMALYFLLFRTPETLKEKKIIYFIVFMVTMGTNRSTTGLISYIVILACYLISGIDKNKKTKSIIMLLIVLTSIYLLFFGGEENLLNTALINKITLNGKLNLHHGTASARMLSFILLADVIRNNPFSLILGVGYDGVGRYITEETALVCSGLISGWIIFGTLTYLVIYGKIANYIIKMKNNIFECLCLIFIMVNNGLGQPDILSIFAVIVGVFFCETRWRQLVKKDIKEI